MILQAHAGAIPLRDQSVHCVVTSPPYYGLREYGLPPSVWGGQPDCEHDWEAVKKVWNHGKSGTSEKQDSNAGSRAIGGNDRSTQSSFCSKCSAWLGCLGLEPTLELYVAHLVEIFREVWRVLRDDGTLWLNLGDSYANDSKWGGATGGKHVTALHGDTAIGRGKKDTGLKPKDLCMIPARVALALQADGWYLRSKITWAKTSCMPESVDDRPTRATEDIFLLTKSERYFYDAIAVAEPSVNNPADGPGGKQLSLDGSCEVETSLTRNMRNFWLLGPQPLALPHYAAFPSEVPRRAIAAGTSERGCCPKCGAPWTRVVEKTNVEPVDYEGKWSKTDPTSSGRRILANVRARRLAGGDHDNPFPAPVTVGWETGCECNAGAPVPCIAFDPFGGSGTVGVVSFNMRRRFILMDLNRKYLDLMRERIPPMAFMGIF